MSISPDVERAISIRIMQEDAEAIYSLLTTERNSIFAMGVIPYYALFVQSCKEFCPMEEVSDDSVIQIKDIRNHIKGYADAFGKSKKKVSLIDQREDENFKTQLRFRFMKTWNIHYNLGTYWIDDHHIVGNTQQLSAFLGTNDFADINRKKRNHDLGYYLGSFVASVRNGLSSSLSIPHLERRDTAVSINKFCDLNTNKNNTFFACYDNKDVNLFFLHLLCNMNFVKYILKPMFCDGNTWVFRVEYIVTYYTYRALLRLRNYAENNNDIPINIAELNAILRDSDVIFQSKFRNCMMHYGLANQGVLSEEHIEKPFYGIVETCFEGKDFDAYRDELRDFADRIINYLESKFDPSALKLHEL